MRKKTFGFMQIKVGLRLSKQQHSLLNLDLGLSLPDCAHCGFAGQRC